MLPAFQGRATGLATRNARPSVGPAPDPWVPLANFKVVSRRKFSKKGVEGVEGEIARPATNDPECPDTIRGQMPTGDKPKDVTGRWLTIETRSAA